MKKLAIILATVLIGLTGCGNAETNEETTTETTASAEVSEDEGAVDDENSVESGDETESENSTESADSAENIESTDDAASYTFRDTEWGMSIEEVKNVETATCMGDGETVLIYEGDFEGLAARIFYYFKDSGEYLYEGEYLISGTGDFKSDYQQIVESLTNKYGEPVSSEEYQAYWEEDGISIEVTLDTTLTIFYADIANNVGPF